MAETALAALYRAVGQRLVSGGDVWGQNAKPDLMTAGVARPYVLYAWAAGGEVNGLVKPDAEIVLTVQGFADSLAQAFTIAGRISALLNDADLSSASPLNGGADWDILNVKQEQAIHLLELIDSRWVYRAGHRFRFRMEAK